MRKLVVSIALAIALLVLALPAPAHEGRRVDGYEIVFGWRVEPAYVGEFNGPELTIYEVVDDKRGEPVSDLENTLQLEVRFGPASKILPLRPALNQPGHYIANLIPTRPGDYTFHLTGTIGDVEIDEEFSSAAGEFSTVEPLTDMLFPDSDLPTVLELQAQIDELRAMIEALQEQE